MCVPLVLAAAVLAASDVAELPNQHPTLEDVNRLLAAYDPAVREVTEQVLAEARARHDDHTFTVALIRLTQLRMSPPTSDPETALKALRAETWPTNVVDRTLLELFYARALDNYLDEHRWQLRDRERIDTTKELDLAHASAEQLWLEVHKSLNTSWQQREQFGAMLTTELGEFLEPNTYPAGVRDTLRDLLTYLWVRTLHDTSWWRPEFTNEINQLDLAKLIAGSPGTNIALDDPGTSPVLKMCALLDDLEQWHTRSKRPEAALEARVTRLSMLYQFFTSNGDRAVLTEALEALLPSVDRLPWSAQARFTLASWLQTAGQAQHARDVALAGARAFPNTASGQRCDDLVKTLEAPTSSLGGLASDGPNHRSLEVSAANLPRLYFHAYRLPAEAAFGTGDEPGTLFSNAMLKRYQLRRPEFSWVSELPATPDLKPHRTFITPPFKAVGAYLVLASRREDFADENNQLVGTGLVVTNLVVTTSQNQADGKLLVTVRDGASGAAVPSATVKLWKQSWNSPRSLEAQQPTDRAGLATFTSTNRDSYFSVSVSAGADFAFVGRSVSLEGFEQWAYHDVFIYTDRAIYRPGQTVQFKVVAYEGRPRTAQFKVQPNKALAVRLLDSNREVVNTLNLKTNDFGSATGSFVVPTGRLLGRWAISTGQNEAGISVEEYKRPSFEVHFQAQKQAAKLNSEVTLTGEARSYFGLPVSDGRVRWQVRRQPVYPWWWWGRQRETGEVIASGKTTLRADGTFTLSFTAKASPKLGREVSYTYLASADVTSEGGETRSSTQALQLGFTAVQASFPGLAEVLDEATTSPVDVWRSSLDGVGRAGKGRYELHALEAPSAPTLPADEPVEPALVPEQPSAGDALHSRLTESFDVMRVIGRWSTGASVAKGELTHGADGHAQLQLPAALASGAYRLSYETTDDFGAVLQVKRDFIIGGEHLSLPVAALVRVIGEGGARQVGEVLRLQLASGFVNQPFLYEEFRAGRQIDRRWVNPTRDGVVLKRPVTVADRGGFSIRVTTVRDWQLMPFEADISVPWVDRQLELAFSTFRDTLKPGAKETFAITVKGPQGALEKGAAEVLASMYDQSLDAMATFSRPQPLSVYPNRLGTGNTLDSQAALSTWDLSIRSYGDATSPPRLRDDELRFFYANNEPWLEGGQRRRLEQKRFNTIQIIRGSGSGGGGIARGVGGLALEPQKSASRDEEEPPAPPPPPPPPPATPALRSNFAEVAFFAPQLLTDDTGTVRVEFELPDSVTGWNVWAEAITKDLRSGDVSAHARSVKELMVRPALPRFLREGDRAELKVVIDNAGQHPLRGQASIDLLDVETGHSVAADFGLVSGTTLPFAVEPSGSTALTVSLTAPKRVGPVTVKIIATAGDTSDGESRSLPILPSRMHLAQSRFVTLHDADSRTMTFADLKQMSDSTRLDEQVVVTVDGQLLNSVLLALPYLVRYPYECTEQTMNRFVSTGIVGQLFKETPALAQLAQKAGRTTALERFDRPDPNRVVALEETPWLQEARGDAATQQREAIAMLDPAVLKAERESALLKLSKAQLSSGAFPWFPGGRGSVEMTLFVLEGLSNAAEFKVDVPSSMVQSAFEYLGRELRSGELGECKKQRGCIELFTLLTFVTTSFPEGWRGGAITTRERDELLELSLSRWKDLSGLSRGQLALSLKRLKRPDEARRVFDSVMASARTTPDEGTFWPAGDHAWYWYHDTIESHAFALRVLQELNPKDARRDGLVQWLLLNKKTNHWKSTRATAEVLYSLVKVLKADGKLGLREVSQITVNGQTSTVTFEPSSTVTRAQVVVPAAQVSATTADITVQSTTPGLQFAQATWRYSTDLLPVAGDGDFLRVARRYFKRVKSGSAVTLQPVDEGARLEVGDELEVQLTVQAKQAAEYVHLRDPRGAGFEPESATSNFRSELGLYWFEEYRDSGTNFFFEALPAGEFTLRYRARCFMAGTFRVGPATLQSVYAPEFNASSAGGMLRIGAAAR